MKTSEKNTVLMSNWVIAQFSLSQKLSVASTYFKTPVCPLTVNINQHISQLSEKHPSTPYCLSLLSLYKVPKLGHLFHIKSIKSLVREEKPCQGR